ncbi:MAG: nuclear transport factor 2 family protein [Burkholderiales bacterium]|nr:nuclear transport factor 2 family protein [Burkholderiales bacterium]
MGKSRKHGGTVEEVEAAYYDAISHADIEALMALWADDEEIVCVHPGAPRLVGHAAIRAAWETIFQRGGLDIRPVQLHAVHNMLTVVHNVIEEVRRGEDESQDMHILATNVYLKTPQGWRLAMHHASVAPGKAPQEPVIASVLH